MKPYFSGRVSSLLFPFMVVGSVGGLIGCGEHAELSTVNTRLNAEEEHEDNKDDLIVNGMYPLSLSAATAFAQSTAVLKKQVANVCIQYNDETVNAAQYAWQDSMETWMFLQGREKGSDTALALSWKIQFWPDKKNTTGRKIRQLLQSAATFDEQDLVDQSVAVQGLGAVEWFLFQEATQLAKPEYCHLAQAITGYLAYTASALSSAWRVNPWQALTPQMALHTYMGALNNQLDRTLKKLTRPMGKPGFPKPYQAEAWRSQTSMMHLKASVQALHQLYLAKGYGLHALLQQQGDTDTAQRIDQRFRLLLADWPKGDSMVSLLQTPEGYRSLIKVFNGLEYIQLALQDDVAVKLGIVMGFNATDGD